MKILTSVIIGLLMTCPTANAAGWGSVHKYTKRSGNCGGQEDSRHLVFFGKTHCER